MSDSPTSNEQLLQSFVEAAVRTLRSHRYCGDQYPEDGWFEVNDALAKWALWRRAAPEPSGAPYTGRAKEHARDVHYQLIEHFGLKDTPNANYAVRKMLEGLTVHAEPPTVGNWYAAEDIDRLVRELDVLLNGEHRAAPQAKLCDIVAQFRRERLSLWKGDNPSHGLRQIGVKHKGHDGRTEFIWWDTPAEGSPIYAGAPLTKPAAKECWLHGSERDEECVDCTACDKPDEHCARPYGICKSTDEKKEAPYPVLFHDGRADETSGGRDA